jgi:intein/homing endonuclease
MPTTEIAKTPTEIPNTDVLAKRMEIQPRSYYFDNEVCERLMHKYVKGSCTDVKIRDEIMSHSVELINQIIKTYNLGHIYSGKEESSIMDLFQCAWIQLESMLYKYEARPHCAKCYNNLRPNNSILSEDYIFEEQLIKKIKTCPNCGVKLTIDGIYYKGKSKIFNLWCVNPNTKVLTDQGISPISGVLDCNRKVYGLDQLQKINGSIKKPKQNTLKITTRLGYNIECTPEHGLYKLDQNGPIWVKAQDIILGDLVGIQYSQQYFGNDDDISDIILTKPNDWTPPKKITEDLAYIFGLYLAEGSYNPDMVSIYNIEDEVKEFFANKPLGLKWGFYPRICVNYNCCQRFSEFLDKMGFGDCHDCHTKKIPSRLLKMSKQNINALLRGMFDGDGHSSRHLGYVGYTSTSIELIEQIRMLLLNIGILSKITKDNRKVRMFKKPNGKIYNSNLAGAYQINLSSFDSLLFYDRIGFKAKRKQEKMKHVVAPQPILLGLNSKFNNLYKAHGPAGHYDDIRKVRTGSRISLEVAKKSLAFWDNYEDNQNYVFIRDRIEELTRARDKITWLPVINIEKSSSEVCDIEVNSPKHSYIANGFISHNSQVARTVILAYIKKDKRDHKNGGTFKTHVEGRILYPHCALERFFLEATELSKYNEQHLKILEAIKELYKTDERPHEGLITKLMDKTGFQRTIINDFFQMIKLRGAELTDSPINNKPDTMKDRMEDEDDLY